MDSKLIELSAQYELLSDEIDALGIALERLLERRYTIEQILDHHTLEKGDTDVDF